MLGLAQAVFSLFLYVMDRVSDVVRALTELFILQWYRCGHHLIHGVAKPAPPIHLQHLPRADVVLRYYGMHRFMLEPVCPF